MKGSFDARGGSGELRILVAEGARACLKDVLDALEDWSLVSVALDGASALKLAAELDPDLILLGMELPPRGGLEVLRFLREEGGQEACPVILLAEPGDQDRLREGFALGAADCLVLPVLPQQVQARVRPFLPRGLGRGCGASLAEGETTRPVEEALMESLGRMAELHNGETGRHIQRTRSYVRLLGDALVRSGSCPPAQPGLLERGAALHDIGKVGIPDAILMKPGRLTPGEFEVMKGHTVLGRDVLLRAERTLGESPFLRVARQIAYTHHERWDGAGYPQGLAGKRIPLPGRIMALADVYDALVSRRVYKEPCSHERAVEILGEERGRQFDPELVDLFLRIHPLFQEVARRFADEEEPVRSGEASFSSVPAGG